MVLASALLLAGCGTVKESKHVVSEPVKVEKLPTGTARLTLTAHAADRLGVATVAVEERDGRKVVSSGAVIVDAKGGRWLYVNQEPLVFVREPIRLANEEAGLAYLAEGPPAGTRVVTLGAAELYGAETGIGK